MQKRGFRLDKKGIIDTSMLTIIGIVIGVSLILFFSWLIFNLISLGPAQEEQAVIASFNRLAQDSLKIVQINALFSYTPSPSTYEIKEGYIVAGFSGNKADLKYNMGKGKKSKQKPPGCTACLCLYKKSQFVKEKGQELVCHNFPSHIEFISTNFGDIRHINDGASKTDTNIRFYYQLLPELDQFDDKPTTMGDKYSTYSTLVYNGFAGLSNVYIEKILNPAVSDSTFIFIHPYKTPTDINKRINTLKNLEKPLESGKKIAITCSGATCGHKVIYAEFFLKQAKPGSNIDNGVYIDVSRKINKLCETVKPYSLAIYCKDLKASIPLLAIQIADALALADVTPADLINEENRWKLGKDAPLSIKHYEDALKLDPESVYLNFLEGRVLAEGEWYQDSINSYNKALGYYDESQLQTIDKQRILYEIIESNEKILEQKDSKESGINTINAISKFLEAFDNEAKHFLKFNKESNRLLFICSKFIDAFTESEAPEICSTYNQGNMKGEITGIYEKYPCPIDKSNPQSYLRCGSRYTPGGIIINTEESKQSEFAIFECNPSTGEYKILASCFNTICKNTIDQSSGYYHGIAAECVEAKD